MTTKTDPLVIERREYGQEIMDRLVDDTSIVYTLNEQSNKDACVKVLEEKFEDLKSMIDGMIKKSRNLGKETQAEFEKDIKGLRQRYDDAISGFNEFRQAGGDAWKELRHGTITAWHDLADGIKNAVGKFR